MARHETVVSGSWEAGGRPRLSVIIPTHDRAPFLSDLAAALEAQTMALHAFDVIVVDDGSTDGTWPWLRDFACRTALRFRGVRLAQNQGPARARNSGVAVARAESLVFTDDDCLPSRGWLEAMDRALSSGAAVVQGRTVPHEPSRSAAGPWARTVWVTRPSGVFETCNIGYRRAVFDVAGGFPENDPLVDRAWGRYFGEDALLGDRAVAAGARMAFAPDALVRHRYLPGSYLEWLGELRQMALFPALAKRSPSFRRKLLAGVFLSRSTLTADVAAIGALASLSSRRAWPLAAVLPWLVARWPEARYRAGGRPPVLRYPQLAAADALALVSLVAGSIQHRRVVL